jgi:RNA polymerase sigma factor (sigma-70 family)
MGWVRWAFPPAGASLRGDAPAWNVSRGQAVQMGNTLLTRASLLARLGDPQDRAAWQQFVGLYGRLVYGFVRQRGLQDADAADLTQEIFLSIARAAGRWRYDPRQGTFRGWLYAVTRNQLARFLRRRRSQPLGNGGSSAQWLLAEQPDPGADTEGTWEQEFQRQLFRQAAELLRDGFAPTTWQAFWRTAVEGRGAAAVAAELGLSVGAVYVAKSRVLARLAEQVQALQSD